MDPYTKEEIQAMRASMYKQLKASVEFSDYDYYDVNELLKIKPFLEDAVKCKSIVNALRKYRRNCDHETTNNRFGNSRALDSGCVEKYVDFKLKTALERNPSTSISELKEIFIAIFKNVWSKGYSKETAQYFGNAVANFVYEDFISQKEAEWDFEKECERKRKGNHTSEELQECNDHEFFKWKKIRMMEKESKKQEKRRQSNAQLEEKKAAAKLKREAEKAAAKSKREAEKAAAKSKREDKKAATKLKTCKKNIEQIDKKREKLAMQLRALEKKRNDLNC
jgi:hypothetical protein